MSQVATRAASPATAGDQPATLSLRNVTKRFGGVAALDDFSCDVAPGELLGVIGPNGAGKSTLLSLINAAQRPTSGEIVFDGTHRIDRMRTHRTARLGIARAHQIPRPFPRMTVRENLLVAAHSRRVQSPVGSGDVDDVLELCGLVDRATRTAGALPLLDLKRLEVARALALGPRLLLLDEVAAGLVAHEIDEITELIDSVHRQGVTILLVEHVQALVQSLAQRVVVLDFGREIAAGTPRQIAEDPEVIRIYLGVGDGERRRQTSQADQATRTPLLTSTGLSVNYGKLRALQDIDFSVGQSEIVAVLGANGAGKTSLARALAGLVGAAGGQITFAGEELTSEPAYRRARKGSPSARRAGGCSPDSKCRRTSSSPRTPALRAPIATTCTPGSTACSRCSRSAPAPTPESSRAASSRWWPSHGR